MEVLLKLLDAARLARLDIKHGTVNEFTHQKLDEAIAEGEAWVNKRNEFREKIREARDKAIDAAAEHLAEIVVRGLVRADKEAEEYIVAYVESKNCSECEKHKKCPILEEYKEIKKRQPGEADAQEQENEENGR